MIAIVSGGQTGVDQGALDAALASGTRCGGWCPRGRRQEDGRIAEKYPLEEMATASYSARTRKNVADSDGTAVITFGQPTGGTALTIRTARSQGKPCLVIDAEETSPGQACPQLAAFVIDHGIETLNVAGPRASHAPLAHAYAYTLTADLIRTLAGKGK